MGNRGVDIEAELLLGIEGMNERLRAFRYARQILEQRSIQAWADGESEAAEALRTVADLLVPCIQDANARAAEAESELDERLEHKKRYLHVTHRPKVVPLEDNEQPRTAGKNQ